MENEAAQYLMVFKFIEKTYKEDFYDKKIVSEVLRSQDFIKDSDIINFVFSEIEEINKKQNLLMERPSHEEIKNDMILK